MSVTLIGVTLVIAGSTAQAGWLFVLAAGVLGAVGGSLILAPRLQGAEIARSLPAQVRIGDRVEVGVTIRNSGRRPLPVMRAEDSLAAFEPVAVLCRELAPGGCSEVHTVRTARRRGVFEEGPVYLRSAAPLGLVRRQHTVAAPAGLTVVPRWVELPRFPLGDPASTGEDLRHVPRLGAGTDYLGVRDYRPGDALRAVHWRTAARAGRLVVREYEDEAEMRVILALSGSDAGEPPDSAFEALVAASASIARYASLAGHRLELVHPQARIVDASFTACLEALAAAAPHDVPLTSLLSASLSRGGGGATVVLLAPAAGIAGADLPAAARMATLAGSRAVAVLADTASWTNRTPARRVDPMGGAVTLTLRRGEALEACLSR